MGRVVRWVLGICAPLLVLSEAFIDGPVGSGDRSWLEVTLPYLPLWGLAVGPRTGLSLWVGALIGAAVFGAPTSSWASAIMPSIVVVAVSAYLLPRRWAILTGCVAPLVSLIIPLLFVGNGLQAGGLLASMVALGVAGGLALNLYRYRTAGQETQIHDLLESLATVRREERRRLGLELHDIIAHDVTVIAMQARRTRFIDNPAQVREIVDTMGTTAQQTLQDLRSLVTLLRTDSDSEQDLASDKGVAVGEDLSRSAAATEGATFESLVAEMTSVEKSLGNAGFIVERSTTGSVEQIPASLLSALTRSARELGTNILKHGDTKDPVGLRLEVAETHVSLCSSNTISATPPISSSGAGLAAMQTRSTVFRGQLYAASEGQMWITQLTFPLEARSENS